MKIAVVFPGQASQYVGMGRELARAFSEADELFAQADEALGTDFRKVLWEGPADTLNLTENTQPAVLTVSIAAWTALKKGLPSLAPAYLAGHSLGEYSALVAAGSIPFPETLRTVRHRGRFMQEAVSVGAGAMAALMGIEIDAVRQACSQAAQGQVVSPANDNAPGQIVIAGHAEAVNRAVEAAKALGCRKAVLLPVSAPFHCALMAPARERLAPELEALAFSDPKWPVVANVDAAPTTDGAAARAKLIAQVDSPVRWRETLLFLHSQGVDTILEVGPGSVLCGLAKRVNRDWKLLNVESPESLDKALAELQG
jgi:[acyl-carrier-protein] S-malonyltransferase